MVEKRRIVVIGGSAAGPKAAAARCAGERKGGYSAWVKK